MENVFKKNIKLHSDFSYGRMGNVPLGRPTLGSHCPVLVYRLMLHTMYEALRSQLGAVRADAAFHQAGALAGYEMAMYRIDLETPPDVFFKRLGEIFMEMGMGRLQLRRYDEADGRVQFCLVGDLLSSGAEEAHAKGYHYDAGLLAGVMEAYTGNSYHMERTDNDKTAANGFCYQGWPKNSEFGSDSFQENS